MICIILCAGYATRLYPLTLDKPKALLEIKGKPIINYIVEKIPKEVEKIFIISNDKFCNHFVWWLSRKKELIDKIEIINDGSISNENRCGGVMDLWLAIEEGNIDDDLLVILGDNLFSFSLNDFINFFNQHKKTTLGVREMDKDRLKNFGIVKVSENKIIDFEEKPENPQSNLISTGIYIFPREDINKIKEYTLTNLNKEGPGYLIKHFLETQDVYAFKFLGDWVDIGTIEEYEQMK